jgi:hypothetical protein
VKVLFLAREGVDLYQELMASETSRDALMFYAPRVTPCGVLIQVSSLGSGIAFTQEMRWYSRRYMRVVLFQITPHAFVTFALANEIYLSRLQVPDEGWPNRSMYVFFDSRLVRVVTLSPVLPEKSTLALQEEEVAIEVWDVFQKGEEGGEDLSIIVDPDAS